MTSAAILIAGIAIGVFLTFVVCMLAVGKRADEQSEAAYREFRGENVDEAQP